MLCTLQHFSQWGGLLVFFSGYNVCLCHAIGVVHLSTVKSFSSIVSMSTITMQAYNHNLGLDLIYVRVATLLENLEKSGN